MSVSYGISTASRLRQVAFYVAVIVVVVFFAFPIFWMALKSFHFTRDITSYEPRFFAPLTLENYRAAFQESKFPRYFLNTALYSITGASATMVLSATGAYVIAKIMRPGIAIAILAIRMAPLMLYLIPTFFVFSRIGLTSTVLGPFLAYLMLSVPPATWLLSGFFRTVDRELEDAATVDGANPYQTFLRIILPQVTPGLVAVFVLVFAQIWNNLILPLIMSGPDTQTLPVMISRMQTLYDPAMGKIIAAANLTTLPVLLLIVLAWRHVVSTFQSVRIG